MSSHGWIGVFTQVYLCQKIQDLDLKLSNPEVYKEFPSTVAIYSYVSLGIGLLGVMLFTQKPVEEVRQD